MMSKAQRIYYEYARKEKVKKELEEYAKQLKEYEQQNKSEYYYRNNLT